MSALRHVLGSGAGFACIAAGLFVAACASDNQDVNLDPENTEAAIPERDAGGAEDVDGGEVCTSDDCEFFPATCEPGALCPSGFFASNPAEGLDWRTRILSIRARSATDAWLVGTVGTAAHFDGTEWKLADVGTLESLRFVWPASGGELTFGTLDRVFTRGLGTGEGNVSPDGWAGRGKLAPPSGATSHVTAAWGRPGSNTMWMATSAEVWRLDVHGTTLTTSAGVGASICSSAPCKWLRSLDGATPSVVWGVGETGAAVRITGADGETPTVEVTNPLTWSRLSGVWAVSDTEAWAVGADGVIIHNLGATFSWNRVDVPARADFYAVAGSSPSDVWVVGDRGVVLHYDGTSWARVKVAGMGLRRPELTAVWVPEPGKVWIGGQGVLLSLGDKP